MTTYRTGNNWGVTIVREGRGPEDVMGHHSGDELVAVVVNGDRELAERICELMNAPTPDVPYTNGAREALAEMRRQMGGSDDGGPTFPGFEQMLRRAAAEVGIPDWDGVE